MTSVHRWSRLRLTSLLDLQGTEVFELGDVPVFPNRADDLSYVVSDGDRLDVLAYRFYGDAVLWWVIAAANEFQLPVSEMFSGRTLRIPSPQYVTQELFTTLLARRA